MPTALSRDQKALIRDATKACQHGDLTALQAALTAEPELVAAAPGPLLKACGHGHLACVEALLAAGADPRGAAGHAEGRPLDRTAAICSQWDWTDEHEAILRLLVERGAEPSQTGRMGFTPLAIAARHGDARPVELLVELGAPVDWQAAAALGRAEKMRRLLAADPELPRRRNVGGFAALNITASSRWWKQGEAAIAGLVATAELLLDHGAELGEFDDGSTVFEAPLAAAAAYGPEAVARLLLDRGAEQAVAFRKALGANRTELLDRLDPACYDLDAVADSKSGNTHLAEAVRDGQLQAAEWLLDHGATADVANLEGWTPLHFGARRGVRVELLQRLVEAGCPVGARTTDGRTALDLAREKRKAPIVAWLAAR